MIQNNPELKCLRRKMGIKGEFDIVPYLVWILAVLVSIYGFIVLRGIWNLK